MMGITVVKEIKQESGLAGKWFGENNMIVYPEKLYAVRVGVFYIEQPRVFYINSNILAGIC